MKVNSNTTFKPRELVWAKIHGYPWWPGIINNIDESYDQPNYMINFFGDTTYSFLDKTKLFNFQDKFGIFSKGQNKQLKVAINLAVDYLNQRGISIDYLNSPQKNLESTDRSCSNTSSLIHNTSPNSFCNKKEQILIREKQQTNKIKNTMNQIIPEKKVYTKEKKQQNIDNFKHKPLTHPLSKGIKKQKIKKTEKVFINIQQQAQNDKMIVQDIQSNQIFESPQQNSIPKIVQTQVNELEKKSQDTKILNQNQYLEPVQKIHSVPQQLISQKYSKRLNQSQKILLFDNLQKWTKNYQQQLCYLKSLQIGDEQIKQLLNQYSNLPVVEISAKLQEKPKTKPISQIKIKKQKIENNVNNKDSQKQGTITKFCQYLLNQKYQLTIQKSKFHAQIFQFLISSSGQSNKYQHKIQLWGQILRQAQFSVEKLHELIKHFVQ